eukprot:gnl/TRDRNA2_/TRDRNA2_172955_c0_seq12.p1 gnl/TRDRNA2_/TRDRNA2_172955_c0~~gnl/TRDRNA2_/TRDRNA2_172955_c0_seq12.p1  ORF type:complete len:370 (-),score=24.98 gnl/TRDRNA2_/TRDRNA2_172955_c0_seq12:128-1102(-)
MAATLAPVTMESGASAQQQLLDGKKSLTMLPPCILRSVRPAELEVGQERGKVWFCSPMNSAHDITPYSKIFGMHPRYFNWDAQGEMVATPCAVRTLEAGGSLGSPTSVEMVASSPCNGSPLGGQKVPVADFVRPNGIRTASFSSFADSRTPTSAQSTIAAALAQANQAIFSDSRSPCHAQSTVALAFAQANQAVSETSAAPAQGDRSSSWLSCERTAPSTLLPPDAAARESEQVSGTPPCDSKASTCYGSGGSSLEGSPVLSSRTLTASSSVTCHRNVTSYCSGMHAGIPQAFVHSTRFQCVQAPVSTGPVSFVSNGPVSFRFR